MSIMGKHVPTDALYPINVLVALKDIEEWISKKEKSTELSVAPLQQILLEMANETPFSPGRFDSREAPLLIAKGEEFRYRRPVWWLIRD